MNKIDTVVARRLPERMIVEVLPAGSTQSLPNRIDWRRLRAMAEEEIEANARIYPDSPPLTADELARMRPVPDPKVSRPRLRLTQEQFAARFDVVLGKLRDWDQGGRLHG